MDIICIMTSIIYTFNTRGQTFKPTSSSFKLLETMNIICKMEFIIRLLMKVFWNMSYCFKHYNWPKAHCKYLRKNPKYSLTKVHEEWKPLANMCCLGCAQLGPKGPAHVSKPKPKNHQQEAKNWEWATSPCSSLTLWEWTKGCPTSFLPPSTWREQCPRAVILAEV